MGCSLSSEAPAEDGLNVVDPAPLEAPSHKVIIIGNSSVGKSSIVTSILDRPFTSEHRSTIGTAYSSLDIVPQEGQSPIQLQLWDTAGEERFKVGCLYIHVYMYGFVCINMCICA
jgi:small GTP-binding protein